MFVSFLFNLSYLIRLGAACPANYNPADHFIQILAGVPGREETTRHTVDTVCTAFAKSELGCSIAAEAENALLHEVSLRYLQGRTTFMRKLPAYTCENIQYLMYVKFPIHDTCGN